MATGSFAEEDLFVAVSKSCAIFLLDPKADHLMKAVFRDSIIPITECSESNNSWLTIVVQEV